MKDATTVHEILKIPRHVAIIMDGNGRWAKERGLPRIQGHRTGAESVREIVRAAAELGIEFVTLYAFSAENWQRPASEVKALMRLLEKFLRDEVAELNRTNIRLQAIGRLNDLPVTVHKQLHRAIEATKKNNGLTLILALSYSGRLEIIDALQSILREVRLGHIDPAQIDEKVFQHHLYTRYYPDPDLLIRTSGEIRLSNFLLWQLSYTEIYVSSCYWPEFRRKQFIEALKEYSKRQRRFGRVSA
jgi:undecaprenyl diphosphate synthase